jgi:LytS/YehU family sensor histidine kinase
MVHHDVEKADYMITSLSDLLRQALDLGSTQEIPLEDELALLSRYLDIQRARFGERLQVTCDVTADVRCSAVPVLLLQPLVENAIHHGLSARTTAGRITIDARRSGARLAITVSDDGRGVSGEALVGRERPGQHSGPARGALRPRPAARAHQRAQRRSARVA